MFKVKLNQFEGPLDLLLFFVKRDELNIHDIPISYITKEFLQYIELIKYLDLEQAGDFILLASTMMHIKAKMLLPREIDEEGIEIDPRAELINRLVEYKKYKEIAGDLSFFEANQRKISVRGNSENDLYDSESEIKGYLKNITLFDLAKAFKDVISNMKPEPIHQIERPPVSLDEQMDYIKKELVTKKRVNFKYLCADATYKIVVIFRFIALLEMVKMQLAGIEETDNFNEFIIYEIEK
ncbi:MAG: segregation/condensation protein A [Ignavibacteriaceae bacterium]|nr:segregation/condensation protein A [Ignavibacteriaceae bacterium]